MRSKSLIILLSAALVFLFTTMAFPWMINKDEYQTLVTPQSNFEMVLEGNQTTQLDYGFYQGTNAFVLFGQHGNRTQSFDGTNTTISWTGPPGPPVETIPKSDTVRRHFGIGGIGQNPPKIKAEYWTPADSSDSGLVPAPTVMSILPLFTSPVGTASAIIGNYSDDQWSIVKAGYRIIPVEALNIDILNRNFMPPDTFISITITDSVLVPNDVDTFTLTSVDVRDDAVVFFIEAKFSGPDTTNTYKETTREWFGLRQWTAPTPFLSSYGIAFLVLILLATAWFVLSRRKVRTTGSAA